MSKFLRILSGVLFLLALVALAFLLLSDLWLRFQPAPSHPHASALALMFVGASFVCLQLSATGRGRKTLKGVLLGLAFVLWGSEQFLPPGAGTIAIDCVVITIFVTDLGLVIKSSLRPDRQN